MQSEKYHAFEPNLPRFKVFCKRGHLKYYKNNPYNNGNGGDCDCCKRRFGNEYVYHCEEGDCSWSALIPGGSDFCMDCVQHHNRNIFCGNEHRMKLVKNPYENGNTVCDDCKTPQSEGVVFNCQED